MRKKILLLVIFMLIIIVGGCGNNTTNPSYAGKNTGSGSNISSGNSIPNKNILVNLNENIKTSGAITDLGKLVVFVTNDNNVPVDMDIEVEFYDANGNILGSGSDDLSAVGAKSEVAVDIWSTPENFDTYKIYVDVVQTTKISYFNNIELVHNNNGKDIVVQVKNNSSDVIDYITVSVVYFQNDKVVGFDESIQSDTNPGRAANFILDYPYNKQYRNVYFDSYKVYVKEAYSYNW